MASDSFFQEEDLLCPVCYDVFRDPVVLPCSHSACKTCMKDYWKHKDHQKCPVCRKRSSIPLPPVSLTLKRLCDGFLQAKRHKVADIGSEKLCGRHKEKFKLFCLEDEQPVCLVCRDSRRHKRHNFCPIDEVSNDYKMQADETTVAIKSTFEIIHQHLHKQETANIDTLRKEETEKKQMVEDKIEELSRIITSLSDTSQGDTLQDARSRARPKDAD